MTGKDSQCSESAKDVEIKEMTGRVHEVGELKHHPQVPDKQVEKR
jgi:hypothetical protein